MYQQEISREKYNIIKVIGVGGGGVNAVNHMFQQGIRGVDFVICNTDQQSLEASSIINKLTIGQHLTGGLGAGANPEMGEKAAIESQDAIAELLGVNTKLLFITAGMGGGTGTGAAPVVARIAKEMGILTVGIITTPFELEGKKRKSVAEAGIESMKNIVDCLLVINNNRINDLYGNLEYSKAFAYANDVLTTAAKGIADIITSTGYINVDFEDIKAVMTNSGVAIMGRATGEGEHRSLDAIEAALNSPLLNNNRIHGAKNVLLNVSSGTKEALMSEINEIMEFVNREAEGNTNVILGITQDDSLQEKIGVTIIATGFEPLENRPVQEQVQWIKRNQSEPEIENNTIETAAPEVSETETQFPLFYPDVISEKEKKENEENKKMENGYTKINRDYVSARNENNLNSISQLRKLNQQVENPVSAEELDKIPAYLRKGVRLEDVPHSSENTMSRTMLVEDTEEKKFELRQNNSFLHDNVD